MRSLARLIVPSKSPTNFTLDTSDLDDKDSAVVSDVTNNFFFVFDLVSHA
jgi:hypothetical protein